MKRTLLTLSTCAALSILCGCANTIMPEKPLSYEMGENRILMTFLSSAVSGSIHLKFNGEIVASGSFGAVGPFAGNSASGSGKFEGHDIEFSASNRKRPVVYVFIDGVEAAELRSAGGSSSVALPDQAAHGSSAVPDAQNSL